MMLPFVNIHTHYLSESTSVISIKNVIAGREEVPVNHYFSIGVHPWYLNVKPQVSMNDILKNPLCLAIGECGLDVQKSILQKNPISIQKFVFEEQIILSNQYQKPLIIHCVKCFDQLLHIRKSLPALQPWIIHGYNKNPKILQALLKAGFYISFGTLIFKSKTLQESLKLMPIDKLFLETDDQQNYNIEAVYLQAAKLLEISLSELKFQIFENFKTVFHPAQLKKNMYL